jgi:hypothetical protein
MRCVTSIAVRPPLIVQFLCGAQDFLVMKVQTRLQCHCPALTSDQLQAHFNGSFYSVLKWFESAKSNVTTDLPNCQSDPMTAFTHDVLSVGNSFNVPLPGLGQL